MNIAKVYDMSPNEADLQFQSFEICDFSGHG